jgi:hypothetical protein
MGLPSSVDSKSALPRGRLLRLYLWVEKLSFQLIRLLVGLAMRADYGRTQTSRQELFH